MTRIIEDSQDADAGEKVFELSWTPDLGPLAKV
jgi:hypothetical protein